MITKKDLHCHYSGLPSPLSYVNDNVPVQKNYKKETIMKRTLQKIVLWWSFIKPKKKKDSIWNI